MDLQPLVAIIVGLLILGLIWKVIKGAIRLALTIAVLLVVGYVVLNYLR